VVAIEDHPHSLPQYKFKKPLHIIDLAPCPGGIPTKFITRGCLYEDLLYICPMTYREDDQASLMEVFEALEIKANGEDYIRFRAFRKGINPVNHFQLSSYNMVFLSTTYGVTRF